MPSKGLKGLKVVQTKEITREGLQKELKQEGFNSYEWSDSPGAYYPCHSHEYNECICVISGKMSFFVEGNEYELAAGKKLYLPAHTIHEAKNKGNEKVTYLIGEMN